MAVVAAPQEEGVQQYMTQIRRYPLLSPEEEQQLAIACAAGDQEAIKQMVSSNLRLVASIAREYAGRGIPMMDLIQEGSMGLLTAARKFDHSLQLRFSTYATKWIRQGISRYLATHSSMIRVPERTLERLYKLRKAQNDLHNRFRRDPTEEELAKACDLTVEKLRQLQALEPNICSLDALTAEGDALRELLEDVNTPQPYEELVRQELKNSLEGLLAQLTQRQQQVLRLRFGMDDGICRSLENIGKLLGISKERARQVESEAVKKLRKLSQGLELEDFLV